MAKVTINGEVFGWDPDVEPLSEALAIENMLKCTQAKWREDLRGGSAHALAAFIWLVWHRNGRDVAWADIESGKVEVDLAAYDIEADEVEPGPTIPPPEASSTTAGNTSPPSAS